MKQVEAVLHETSDAQEDECCLDDPSGGLNGENSIAAEEAVPDIDLSHGVWEVCGFGLKRKGNIDSEQANLLADY